MSETRPYLFISYRRDDTQWIARSLHRYLSERLGSHSVFMDRVEIRGGEDWRGRINRALQDTTVLLVIIGRQWLKLTDNFGRLRIDQEDDWVRNEIRATLGHKKTIIPLYVDEAPQIVDLRALPKDVQSLMDAQAIVLSLNFWDQGLLELVRTIGKYGFEVHNPRAGWVCLDRNSPWISGSSAGCSIPILSWHAGRA